VPKIFCDMELPTLGKNCMREDCNDLDFLPIKCQYCGDYFCAKHFLPVDHFCKSYDTSSKPTVSAKIEKYFCTVPGCNKSELAPVSCNYCFIVICLSHRHQQDHNCSQYTPPQQSMVATKAVVREILSKSAEQKPPKKLRSLKAQKTAAKVQLMKLKMKSTGDKCLPQEERIYFLVIPPKKTGKFPGGTGVWVSNKWVMGKIVDSIADSLSVPNFNNSGDRERLKLFRGVDGVSVCEDMSAPVKNVLDSEELFNGDKVILEYVENNASSIDIS